MYDQLPEFEKEIRQSDFVVTIVNFRFTTSDHAAKAVKTYCFCASVPPKNFIFISCPFFQNLPRTPTAWGGNGKGAIVAQNRSSGTCSKCDLGGIVGGVVSVHCIKQTAQKIKSAYFICTFLRIKRPRHYGSAFAENGKAMLF